MQFSPTCALGFVGGVWICPEGVRPCPGVVVEPRTACTPGVSGRVVGGTMTRPGGGETVPGVGEVVPVG